MKNKKKYSEDERASAKEGGGKRFVAEGVVDRRRNPQCLEFINFRIINTIKSTIIKNRES